MDAAELPVPPDGVRPGYLGLIATGRVILGDIAATAVDLSMRGLLQIESTAGSAGDWILTPAEPPGDCEDPLEYERVLLEWMARPGYATSLAALADDLPSGLEEVREDLVPMRYTEVGCAACITTSEPKRARNWPASCGLSGGSSARQRQSEAQRSWTGGCCHTRCISAWPVPAIHWPGLHMPGSVRLRNSLNGAPRPDGAPTASMTSASGPRHANGRSTRTS
jgi:hypothetical protein